MACGAGACKWEDMWNPASASRRNTDMPRRPAALRGPLRGPKGPQYGYWRPLMAPVGPYMTTDNLYTMEIRVYKHIVEW